MDADWREYHPAPKRPNYVLPSGAVDVHCHVFGPSSAFPFAPERRYTPCIAGKDKLFALRDHLGFLRNVIVQATCHGKDNRAMVDACRSAGDLARGIASGGPDVTLDALREMDAAGARGVRFNFVKRLVDATPKEVFLGIAEKVAQLGLHIVVYFEAADLEELVPFLNELPTVVVVDNLMRLYWAR
ncbi:amidohydrolase family protein [Sedimentitalea sp.]|uniref:amidohydrolase family protein n=1 Tax=Sedimentitalea sp. TaxID=2048915 RepID=UPI003297A7FB